MYRINTFHKVSLWNENNFHSMLSHVLLSVCVYVFRKIPRIDIKISNYVIYHISCCPASSVSQNIIMVFMLWGSKVTGKKKLIQFSNFRFLELKFWLIYIHVLLKVLVLRTQRIQFQFWDWQFSLYNLNLSLSDLQK